MAVVSTGGERLRKRGGESYLRAVRENFAKHEGHENYKEVARERAEEAIIARVKEETEDR